MSYAPSCVCSPSRASIFSERHVGVTRIRGNKVGSDHELPERSTFVHALHDSGYRTGYFGKWGLGSYKGGPWNQGFDEFTGQLGHKQAHGVFPFFVQAYNGDQHSIPSTKKDFENLKVKLTQNQGKRWSERTCPLNVNNLPEEDRCVYVNDVVREASLEFIKRNRADKRRFFMVWSPSYPHNGLWSPQDSWYKKKSPVKRMTPKREGTMTEAARGHAAQIEQHLDGDIGALLDVLQSDQKADANTLLVFTSDNGAHNEAIAYDLSYFNPTGGLRSHKRYLFDGGLRVPTMVRWPGKIKGGTVSRIPQALYDLGPTFREVADLPPPEWEDLSGKPSGSVSMLKSWLSGKESDAPARDWLHFEFCRDASRESQCDVATIDISKWRDPDSPVMKLVEFSDRKLRFLFDIREDPIERSPIVDADELGRMRSLRESVRFSMFQAPAVSNSPAPKKKSRKVILRQRQRKRNKKKKGRLL